MTLAAYMQEQTAARLRKLAYELRNARQSMDEERVHDLRVATRRLMETLRVIKGVLPEEGVDAVLADLRKVMNAAGEVRSCDIAAELLRQAGALDISPLLTELAARRVLAERTLFERAHDAYRRNATQKWRSALLPTRLPTKLPAKALPVKPPAKAQP